MPNEVARRSGRCVHASEAGATYRFIPGSLFSLLLDLTSVSEIICHKLLVHLLRDKQSVFTMLSCIGNSAQGACNFKGCAEFSPSPGEFQRVCGLRPDMLDFPRAFCMKSPDCSQHSKDGWGSEKLLDGRHGFHKNNAICSSALKREIERDCAIVTMLPSHQAMTVYSGSVSTTNNPVTVTTSEIEFGTSLTDI